MDDTCFGFFLSTEIGSDEPGRSCLNKRLHFQSTYDISTSPFLALTPSIFLICDPCDLVTLSTAFSIPHQTSNAF